MGGVFLKRLARRVIWCTMIVSFVWCISVITGRNDPDEEKNRFHGMQTELETCLDLSAARLYMQENLMKLRDAAHQTMELVGMNKEEAFRYIRAICNYLSGE